MQRLKLTVQYDGGGFYGWQRQDGLPTVQGALMEALEKIVEHKIEKMPAAGRTDAGVHAWGQVCHVDVEKDLRLIQYIDGLNHFLPHTIRVVRAARVEEEFHARYGAVARHYVYRMFNARQLRPDLVGHALQVNKPLDVGAMQEALAGMPTGVQDFSAFRDFECQSKHPLCDLKYIELVQGEAPQVLELRVGANRFLHHMVRNMVGTLLDVGLGKRERDGMAAVMATHDRTQAGITAPADGLYFARVDYAEHVESEVLGE